MLCSGRRGGRVERRKEGGGGREEGLRRKERGRRKGGELKEGSRDCEKVEEDW